MAKKKRQSIVPKGEDATGPVHRPRVKMDHIAQEVLQLDKPDEAAELCRKLRPRHKDAVLMRVRGAKRNFDGTVTL